MFPTFFVLLKNGKILNFLIFLSLLNRDKNAFRWENEITERWFFLLFKFIQMLQIWYAFQNEAYFSHLLKSTNGKYQVLSPGMQMGALRIQQIHSSSTLSFGKEGCFPVICVWNTLKIGNVERVLSPSRMIAKFNEIFTVKSCCTNCWIRYPLPGHITWQ